MNANPGACHHLIQVDVYFRRSRLPEWLVQVRRSLQRVALILKTHLEIQALRVGEIEE